MTPAAADASALIESRYAWLRLAASLAFMTLSSCGMYAIVVVLPAVQSEFAVDRGAASLPYTLTMIGFGIGGVVMGRVADRFGVRVPLGIGSISLSVGFIAAAYAPGLLSLSIIQGVLIGFLGTAGGFSPLIADASLWFTRRRGIAVAICASGNYLAGTVWPPIVQALTESWGWRSTYVALGVFCLVCSLPLLAMFRIRAPLSDAQAVPRPMQTSVTLAALPIDRARPFGLPPNVVIALLCCAGVACCVAMSMPQVHIVAYCGDLGYGSAAGAQMLSLMLGFGIVSRLISGWVADRIGGLRTLLAGAALQAVALALYLPFDGLGALYVIAILFGLFQGGIVPSYALVVREFFPAAGSATRIALVINSTLLGMALGGWLSGSIFDFTGSYDAAFVNGIVWNLFTVGVAWLLLRRSHGGRAAPSPA
jgi:MFS family permease